MRQHRAQLRRQLRRQRRALSRGERQQAARRAAPNLVRALGHRPARHVAVYLASDGELDLQPALQHSRFTAVQCYLPFLDPLRRGYLRFRRWHPERRMRPNRYGIAEPAVEYRARRFWALDVVVIPAVAFNSEGYRLGMGGGYFDRTLSDLARRPRRPRLVVAGYEFQRCEDLPVADWDQPADVVVTDAGR